MPLDGGAPVEIPCSFNPGRGGVIYALPALANGSRFSFQLIRRTEAKLVKSSYLTRPASPLTKSLISAQMNPSASQSASGSTTLTLASAIPSSILFRSLPGTEVRANEKLLYSYYFRTSKFNTLSDKIKQLTFKKTDYTLYWGDHELLVGNFGTGEDFDDYEQNNYATRDILGITLQHVPLIVVTAHAPTERWFTQYVWPKIYSPIQRMRFAGLWPEELTDRFFLLLGLRNFETTAMIQSSSGGKLHVFSLPLGGGVHGGMVSFGGSGSPADIKVKYLHGTTIPDDYFSLWFKSHMIMLGYARGDCDDSGARLYGKQEWIQQNLGWLQAFSALDLNSAVSAYVPMYKGSYKVNFIYGPKFTWDSGGPWTSKDISYGQSAVKENLTTAVKSSASTFVSQATTVNSPATLKKKSFIRKP
jgi:hypothetical protein